MPNKINPLNCVSSPLRVAVVLGHWQNYGVETLTLNLYRNIDKNRVQFDFVICETPNSDIPVDEIESLGGRVYIVPTFPKLSSTSRRLNVCSPRITTQSCTAI